MKQINNILFVIGVISSLLFYVYRENLILLAIFFGVGVYLLIYNFKYSKRINLLLIYLMISIIVFSAIKILVYGYPDRVFILKYCLVFVNFGFALELLNTNKMKQVNILYLLINIYLTVFILLGYQSTQLSDYNSGNIVNFIYIAFSVLVVATTYYYREKVLFYPAILSIIISFWSQGRGGMIISLIFFLILFLIRYRKYLSKLGIGLFLILTAILSKFIVDVSVNLFTNIVTRFGTRNDNLIGSSRGIIWQSYFEQLNHLKFFLGFDFVPLMFVWYPTVHNSFFDFQISFGILGVIILLCILYYTFKLLALKQFLYFLCSIIILMRGFTDTVLFVNNYDFILIFIILISMTKQWSLPKEEV